MRCASAARLNILLILADDVGYSDIGCWGGEVHTPNLNWLAAAGGWRWPIFAPDRRANMVGVKPQDDLEGYSGHFSEQCATIPEVLRWAGSGSANASNTPFRFY